MKKHFFISLSLTCAMALFAASATPLYAQGMISAPSLESDLSEAGLDGLVELDAQEVSTIQRLLRRLGYLKTENMTRKMDAATTAALVAHFQAENTSADGLSADKIMRSLFTAAWTKEGWATGSADGQSLVVDRAEVRQAQDALKKLNYAPGPSDGVFGPATLSAIEIFQEDSGMNV
ncbi:MAG TPA: peptidoglycan-binding domain-containing protein, partial [Aestuariivirga sp.]|nr:peptidoglycan-binding domain-containing protein [Aestuariivirga sp.]